MAFESEFAQILREKMGTPPQSPQNSPLPKSNFKPFPHWKFQFSAAKRTFTPAKIPSQYPENPPSIPSQKAKRVEKNHQPPEPHYKIGELGLELASPLLTLQRLGADIDPQRISLSLLKKEYRKLAKIYHPDQSDLTESKHYFQEVCLAYSQILDALNKMSKK